MNELLQAAKAVIDGWDNYGGTTQAKIQLLRAAVERAENPPAGFEEWSKQRCDGFKLGKQYLHICPRRETCARYVERHTGGERTPNFAYLCLDGSDMFIPVEKKND